ncbi:MAG: hypothetical protein FIA95_07890 [Gemmatimonadetes bacterium]|nr:hypothetical protein [Gemmatimonadota bacterium]
MLELVPVTTDQMWTATLIAGTLVLVLASFASVRVRAPFPPRLSPALLVAGVVWFTALYAWAAWTFWDTCYGAILPAWARTAAPFVGAVDGFVGWGFWWIARRVSPHRPVAPFLLLGALLSLPGHVHGIYGRGLLDRCAVVQGITPASALVFGLFEFAFYWALVLLVAHAAATLRKRG